MELISSLLLVISFYWLFLCNHVFVVSGLCLDDQRSLLLQFKNNLTFTNMAEFMESKWWLLQVDGSNLWQGWTCYWSWSQWRIHLWWIWQFKSTLFSLQHLQSLNLAANCFLSKIPSGFNKLENLTYLNLSESSFMRQIPIEISQLTRLVTLDLSSISYARGPKLLLENPNLQKLVQNITSIRQLYLDGVDRTAPGHEWSNALSSLHDLQELSMPGCNLSGPLDPSLARLENLSVIVLDNNNLSSPMPETFSHFKNFTILSLNNCGLTGTFPHKIFYIGTLSVIDISWNNNLHGFLPEFPSSGSLYSLSVSHTNFSGAIPLSIGNMRNLPELDLSNCGFKGTIPNSLSNLTKLRPGFVIELLHTSNDII